MIFKIDIRMLVSAAVCIQLMTLVAGCATYGPADSASSIKEDAIFKNEVVVSMDTLEVHLVALTDKKLAKNYIGIDPAKSNMIPALMKIQNNGNNPVKIDMSQTYLSTKSGENYKSLPIEESIERARRSDAEVVGWTAAFGIFGALASGSQTASANRSLEEDYHNKHFKPTLINAKCSAQGIVFFDVPEEKQPDISSAVIQVLNLNTNDIKKISVNLLR